MYRFEKIDPTEADWKVIESTYDATVYKTRCWMEFLELEECAPFICAVYKGTELLGYFIGEQIHRVVTIIGSPFEGVGTAQQGLSMLIPTSGSERLQIYKELAEWIFKTGYASFLQVEDWYVREDDLANTKMRYNLHRVKYVDSSVSEDEMYARMKQDCKYSIRKAKANGITIRETTDVKRFVEVFYEQFSDVFHKQQKEIVKSREWYGNVIKAMYPENMMLLEAVTPEDQIVATGIILVGNHYASTWQTASYSQYQHLRPNEILRWEAMARCKQRGVEIINFCGTQAYKDKFGAILIHIPVMMFAKYSILIKGKQWAKKVYYDFRQLITRFKKE